VHAVSAPLPGNPVAGSPPASGGAGARAQAALARDRQSRDE